MWNSRSLTGRPIWMRFLIVKKQVSAAKIKWLFLGFCWGFLISRVREKSLSEPGVSCVFYLGNRRLHLLPFSFLSLCLVERAQCTMSCKVCSRTVWVGSSLWNGPRTRLQHFRVRPAFGVRKHLVWQRCALGYHGYGVQSVLLGHVQLVLVLVFVQSLCKWLTNI